MVVYTAFLDLYMPLHVFNKSWRKKYFSPAGVSSPGVDVITWSLQWVSWPWLMHLGQGVQSATPLRSASRQNLRGQKDTTTTLSFVSHFIPLHWERDEMCLSLYVSFISLQLVAESWRTRRLKWSYCYRWINVETQMNAGYEKLVGTYADMWELLIMWSPLNVCDPPSISLSQLLAFFSLC